MVSSRSQSPANSNNAASPNAAGTIGASPMRGLPTVAPVTPAVLLGKQSLDMSLGQFLSTVKGADTHDRAAKAEKALHSAEVFSTEDLVGATVE